MNNEKIKGGKVINSGGYGCIFKPALKCLNRTRKKDDITKLMKRKYTKKEYHDIIKFKKILSVIPNYSDYFLVDGFSMCSIDKLTQEDLEHFDADCSALKKIKLRANNINNSLDSVLALNMPYGGIDLSMYVENENINYNKLIILNNKLIELLQHAIIPMNNHHVYHCDIKDSNILIREENNVLKTRIIDWGLSTSIKKNITKIPKILRNRPLQFNIPFSIILFNNTFKHMYSSFLKNNAKPNYQDIRTFVINYVMVWIKERGKGHLNTMNNIFQMFYEKELLNVEEKIRKDILEHDYTLYFIFEYLTEILVKFTKNGKFHELEYFNHVFLKNLDIWGFITVYLPISETLFNYDKISNTEHNIIDKIKEIIMFIIKYSFNPVDIKLLIHKLKELNSHFLKAHHKLKIKFGSHYTSITSNKTKKTYTPYYSSSSKFDKKTKTAKKKKNHKPIHQIPMD